MKVNFYFDFQNGGKMLKAKPERITYAQEKLIALIEGRKLRAWCLENNLNHSIIYRIALGEAHPTYKTISSSTHLIAPIEWLFYTDEALPYVPRLLPQWDASKNSAFVLKHRNDYRELEKRYGITETAAYNMCVVYRAKPSVSFMRECCKDTDPIEFFIDGELPEAPVSTEPFIPERGDIVNIQGRQVLVLSKKSFSEKTKKIVGVPVITADGEGTALEGAKTKGFALSSDIASFSLSSKMRPLFIESINESAYGRILSEARAILEP